MPEAVRMIQNGDAERTGVTNRTGIVAPLGALAPRFLVRDTVAVKDLSLGMLTLESQRRNRPNGPGTFLVVVDGHVACVSNQGNSRVHHQCAGLGVEKTELAGIRHDALLGFIK